MEMKETREEKKGEARGRKREVMKGARKERKKEKEEKKLKVSGCEIWRIRETGGNAMK